MENPRLISPVLGLLTKQIEKAGLKKNDGIISAMTVRVNDGTAQAGDLDCVVCVGDDVNSALCLQGEQKQEDKCLKVKSGAIFRAILHKGVLLQFAKIISHVNNPALIFFSSNDSQEFLSCAPPPRS